MWALYHHEPKFNLLFSQTFFFEVSDIICCSLVLRWTFEQPSLPPIIEPSLPQSSRTSQLHWSEAVKSSYCLCVTGEFPCLKKQNTRTDSGPLRAHQKVSIKVMLIALSQAFHSNWINLDLLLLSLCCLQLLFAFGTISLLLFDQFNLHMERTTMNVNVCLCFFSLFIKNVCV